MNAFAASISVVDSRALSDYKLSRNVVGLAPLTEALLTSAPWAPALVKDEWLANANFLSSAYLAYDIDNYGPEGGWLLEAPLIARLAKTKLAYILGASKSHLKPKTSGNSVHAPAPRFRLIVPLEAPVYSQADYQASWTGLAIGLGIKDHIDATSDPARFYLPCISILSSNLVGEKAPALHAAPLSARPRATTQPQPPTQRRRLHRSTMEFIAHGAPSGEWHHHFIRAALNLKECGYSRQEAEEMLEKATGGHGLDAAHDIPQLDDVYSNNRGRGELTPGPVPVSLPPFPAVDERGRPLANHPQNLYYVAEELEHLYAFHEVRSGQIWMARGSLEGTKEPLTDYHLDYLLAATASRRLAVAKNSVHSYLHVRAKERPFDRFLDPVASLKWDGKDRLDELFGTLTISESATAADRAWYKKILWKWLLGLMARVCDPGSENMVLIFYGQQGAGKSRWFQKLARAVWADAFVESQVKPGDKDHELKLLENVLWMVSELDTTTSMHSTGALKDFLTRNVVKVRRPYDRLDTTGKVVCSFCATVNTMNFLHDTTGNRRFLVIPVEKADADHQVNLLQVFAQVREAYQRGDRYWFDAEEIATINAYAAAYAYQDETLAHFEQLKPGQAIHSLESICRHLRIPVPSTKAARIQCEGVLSRKGVQRVNHSGYYKWKVELPEIEKPSALQKIRR